MANENELDGLDGFESRFSENTGQGQSDGLLRINWYNGEAKLGTPGHFFVSTKKLEALGVDAPSAPWKSAEKRFENGSSDEGYEAVGVKMMIVGVRQQDCVVQEGRIVRWLDGRPSKDSRPAGWAVYVEVLAFVEGFNCPVVWSAKTIKTSMGILAGILPDYRKFREDLKKERGSKSRAPLWAFWLPIAGAKDAKGKPVYEQTKGKPVTPPTLRIAPDSDVQDVAKKLFVGRDGLTKGEALREEWDEWLQAKHSNDEFEQPQPTAAPVKNRVQEVSDDDLY